MAGNSKGADAYGVLICVNHCSTSKSNNVNIHDHLVETGMHTDKGSKHHQVLVLLGDSKDGEQPHAEHPCRCC